MAEPCKAFATAAGTGSTTPRVSRIVARNPSAAACVRLPNSELYACFRRDLIEAEREHELDRRLAYIVDRLAELRASATFAQLRIIDRVQFRALHARILSWLGTEQPRNAQAGHRAWSDLRSFASLLLQVNNRHVLQEHDRNVVNLAYSSLFAEIQGPDLIPFPILSWLRTLEGKDEELDRLLLSAPSLRVEDWESAIRRLRRAA